MRYTAVLFLAGILLSTSPPVAGQQAVAQASPVQRNSRVASGGLQNCGPSDLARQQQQHEAQTGCTQTGPVTVPLESISACASERVFAFQMNHDGEPVREVPISHVPGNSAIFYEAGMTIDADGAPNAYHPDNTGLDDLANAGAPGHWQALAKNEFGEPIVQGPGDPYPGYYVSTTALSDRTKSANDPSRYVDASKIPFIVLPGGLARQFDARPGDFAAVINRQNGRISYAIYADIGPFDRIGEGSVALAENLGIRSDARNGGSRGGILYLIFPGSGNDRPRSLDEINVEGDKLFQDWGGATQLNACVSPQPTRPIPGSRGAN